MSSEFSKPEAVDQEIILNPTKVIMSKTDKEGTLEFANDYFMEVSGYEAYELMGKSVNFTQHPDMPEAIVKMMWDRLSKKENFPVLIKNLAKSGKYYWTISDYDFKADDESGEIIAIYNRRKNASREAVTFFDKLYKKLKNIERESGVALSEKYLDGRLEELGKSFGELLQEYTKNTVVPKPKPYVAKTVSKPVEEVKKTEVKKVESKDQERARILQEQIAKGKEIQNKEKKVVEKKEVKKEEKKVVIKKTDETSKPEKKKSFFQKMFGKTEEELEEERRLRGE